MRSARRQSVDDRIRHTAQETGTDANRLRRMVAFQRLLVRLAPHDLILKGGYCLEARLGPVARATKDVDLVGRIALAADPDQLLDVLEPMLAADPDDDGFRFRCSTPRLLRSDQLSPPAWRIRIEAVIDGTTFETVTLDLVGQIAEILGATEVLSIAPPVTVPGWSPAEMDAVDVYQHAAEKFHAFARLYAGDRPSSRVKDLLDLVLLVDAGLLGESARLGVRLRHVWSTRDAAPPPTHLPVPPASWQADYERFRADLELTAQTVDAAYDLIVGVYAGALTGRTIP